MKLTKRKGFNFFRSYYDVFNELNDTDKLIFITALLDKQFLGVEPKELSGMAKFAWISQTNSIDNQVKGYNDKMKGLGNPLLGVTNTPTEGGGIGGRQGGFSTPTAQVQEKGKGKGKVQYVKFNFKKSLLDLGAGEESLNDWLVVRKKKKASNTPTALKLFLAQVEKSGKPIAEVVELCAGKSWVSFQSEWVNSNNSEKKRTLI